MRANKSTLALQAGTWVACVANDLGKNGVRVKSEEERRESFLSFFPQLSLWCSALVSFFARPKHSKQKRILRWLERHGAEFHTTWTWLHGYSGFIPSHPVFQRNAKVLKCNKKKKRENWEAFLWTTVDYISNTTSHLIYISVIGNFRKKFEKDEKLKELWKWSRGNKISTMLTLFCCLSLQSIPCGLLNRVTQYTQHCVLRKVQTLRTRLRIFLGPPSARQVCDHTRFVLSVHSSQVTRQTIDHSKMYKLSW